MFTKILETSKVRFDFFAAGWVRCCVEWAVGRITEERGERCSMNEWLHEACVEKLQRDHPGRFDDYLKGIESLEDALNAEDKPGSKRKAK